MLLNLHGAFAEATQAAQIIIISGIILKLGLIRQGRKQSNGGGKESYLLDIDLAADMHPLALYGHDVTYGTENARSGTNL